MEALVLNVAMPGHLVPDGWAKNTVKPWLAEQTSPENLKQASAQLEAIEAYYKSLGVDELEITKGRRYVEIRLGEVDEIRKDGPKTDNLSFADDGLSRDIRHRFRELAKGKEKIEALIESAIDAGEISRAKLLKALNGAHVGNNSGENEWYTPPVYIQSARKVMGSIDLDPASSAIANKTIKAKKYFDEETDGLFQAWKGNIWLNPPYAQPLIFDFILKLETESYEQAIVLVNNATETKWGQKLIELSNAVCFHTGRIRFINPDGELGEAPLQGQMIAYIGKNYKAFISEFKQYGICLRKGV